MKAKLFNLYLTFLLVSVWVACEPARQPQAAAGPIDNDSLLIKYRQEGKLIVSESFKALSKALLTAIDSGGVSHALQFCNLQAIPLTDSMARLYGAEVRRVSNKNRNPANKASEDDLEIMTMMQQAIEKSKLPSDTIFDDKTGNLIYAAPIVIAPPCLRCHGMPENEIAAGDLQLIRSLYPDDKAVDYQTGMLRGIWKITFKR